MRQIKLGSLTRTVILLTLLLPALLTSGSVAAASTSPPTTKSATAITGSTPDATATTGSTPDASPQVIQASVYLTRLYKFNPVESSFDAVLWLTTNYPKQIKHYQNRIEFISANKQSKMLSYLIKSKSGFGDTSAKYYITLDHHFDLSRYPFDTQVLHIRMEDARSDASKLKFQFTNPNSGAKGIIDPDALPKGWKLKKIQSTVRIHRYNVNFNNPMQPFGVSDYSQLSLKIFIQRNNTRLFFSIFGMLYLAYLLSLFSLMMPIEVSFLSTTSGLLVASVFSLVGNFIISNNYLLHTLAFTLIDKVQLATLVLILLTYSVLIFNSYLAKSNKIVLADKTRRFSIVASISIYFILNLIIFM
jgi:hypothetical protein